MMLVFDDKGLIPVIVQDHITAEVLMLAYANQEAIDRMTETGETWFWSRSRQQLWHKGKTSGHYQQVVSMQTDCDSDALLVRVKQTGFACHLDRRSCFHDVIYGDLERTSAIVPVLLEVIRDRKDSPIEGSYTNLLLSDRVKRLKKVIEESGEVSLAIMDGREDEVAWELADLIYHLMVAIVGDDIDVTETYRKLWGRRQ